ncbi:MAG: flagellar biosynthetic protein FliR [Lachnospiraceae bacterium]|nr:flagellar biosynthetic protein FliR [Lachnospiraceae bacterium]
MKLTFDYIEYAILVFARVSMVMVMAPFFSNTNISRRLKAAIAFFLSVIVMNTVDYTAVSYTGAIGYSILLLKEAITGLLIGAGAGLCMYILNFSGNMIDMEIGFAMAMEMDPTTQVQTTITATLFTSAFMLMFIANDMHYYIIKALCDSYKMIPVGGAALSPFMYQIAVQYITDFFIIGFRIILPIFSCILVINVVLGILAKVAPQMNMFVIGIQLKLFVGLALLYVLMSFLPGITDFIFDEMQKLTKLFIQSMAA